MVALIILMSAVAIIAMVSSVRAAGHVRRALELVEASDRDRLEMQKSLFTIVDMDGKEEVKALLASPTARPPMTTPCGKMCSRSFWMDGVAKPQWYCYAGEGYTCSSTRPKLEDATGNCPHYRPSEFARDTEKA